MAQANGSALLFLILLPCLPKLSCLYGAAANLDRNLEEDVQWYKYEQTTEHIGRCNNHSQYEQYEERIAAAGTEKLGREDADTGEKVNQHGQLEHYTKGNDEIAHGIIIIVYGDDILEQWAELVIAKEVDGVGSHYKVGEHNAHKKQQRAPEHDTPGCLDLVGLEGWANELPEFPENVGEHQYKPQHKGYRQTHHELTCDGSVLKFHLYLVHTERFGV